MPRKPILSPESLLSVIGRLQKPDHEGVASSALAGATGVSLAAIKRLLATLVRQGAVQVTGKARATRYQLPPGTWTTPDPPAWVPTASRAAEPQAGVTSAEQPEWTPASTALRGWLGQPLASRPPVTYRRDLLEQYQPNQMGYLPQDLADELASRGSLADLASRGVAPADLPRLHGLARLELDGLAEHNCARWRLGLRDVQLWIGAGRPLD